MTNRVVKLTLITDFACANCFILEHELLEAITECKENLNLPLSFELEHVPFKLISTNILKDNETAKLDREEFLIKHIGKERFPKVQAAIAKWADEKGIPISFQGVMSQTTRAHRLCQKAYKQGGQKLQLPLFLAIFKAYLQEGKDIADIDLLSDVAAEVDVMSKEQAVAFLESAELEKEVNQISDRLRTKGVTGVPVLVIDGKWAVSGGQSSDVFVQIFKKLAGCGGINNPCNNPPSPFVSFNTLLAERHEQPSY